jgi:hypothetical protein
MKLNKGSILKASVEYVKELKHDQRKLASFKDKQRAIEAKCQSMLIRIFVSVLSHNEAVWEYDDNPKFIKMTICDFSCHNSLKRF